MHCLMAGASVEQQCRVAEKGLAPAEIGDDRSVVVEPACGADKARCVGRGSGSPVTCLLRVGQSGRVNATPLAGLSLAQVGIPPYDIVRVDGAEESGFFLLAGDRGWLETRRAEGVPEAGVSGGKR